MSHLYEHDDAGCFLADTEEEAMEMMGDELMACDRKPDAIRQIADDALITTEDENGKRETKTAAAWIAEATAVGVRGFLFGNYTVQP